MGRGWAVEWLSLFIQLSKSTALGGSVTLGLAAGTGTSSKCLSETLSLPHTERQELKGSVAVPDQNHSLSVVTAEQSTTAGSQSSSVHCLPSPCHAI